jgi:class 3 adenylate cyclase
VSQVLDSIQAAREASGRYAWREAYDLYAAADRKSLSPGDLERFGDAAWLTGKLEEAIDLRERAYAGFTSAGDTRGAARIALTLSWDHSGRSEFSVAAGWLANAERLLEGQPESAEHGYLMLTRAINAMFGGVDLKGAVESFGRAHELGRRFGDRDTEILALVGKGRMLLKLGEIDNGLALIDEASAAAACGQLQPYATGLVYCMTISSCQELGDYRRAAEWTEAANRWCDRLDVTGFPGACRIHRAEILRLRGEWPEAERQALAACAELYDFERSITGHGYYEIGEIRRRRGDFAGAEEAYRTADELGRSPQPGLSLLRLAEGKVEAAVSGLRRTLDEKVDSLARITYLAPQVEITLAAGDVSAARAAAEELERIVDTYRISGRRAPAFDATVHLAFGQIRLAEEDWDGAARCFQRGLGAWREVGAPYEIARARLLLGLAFRRQGDEHAATGELEAALATFERLGAKLDEERVKELLGRLQARRTFLFTDIVDSTRLLATLGDEKWQRLLARHNELVSEQIGENGGEVIKHTGDGFFASFDSPKAAIDAAVAIQRALDGEIVAPDVRIGAHAGSAFQTGDRSDYTGQSVHTAARIGAAAGAGEILVSSETLDGVGSAFRLSRPRAQELKGFDEPVEVVTVGWR